MVKREEVKKPMSRGLKITLIILAVIGGLVVLGLIILVIFGLTTGVSGYKDTLPVGDTFYSGLKSHDYSTIDGMLSEEFLNNTSKDKLNSVFTTLDNKLGTVQTYSFVGFNVHSYAGGSTYVVLRYEVNRTKYTSYDTLTLVKSSDRYLILGFNTNSQGLLEDNNLVTGKVISN